MKKPQPAPRSPVRLPLRTIVIHCYDPRAATIPFQLAKLWPDETYPGDLIFDDQGNKVGSTATIFPIVAGGRAKAF